MEVGKYLFAAKNYPFTACRRPRLPLVPSFEFPASGVWGGMAAARAAPESCQPVVRTLQPTPARAFRLPPSPLSSLIWCFSTSIALQLPARNVVYRLLFLKRERNGSLGEEKQRVVICFNVLMIYYHYDQAAARVVNLPACKGERPRLDDVRPDPVHAQDVRF